MNFPGEEYEAQGSHVRKSCQSHRGSSWSHFHASSMSTSSLKHRAMYTTAAWESSWGGTWKSWHPVPHETQTIPRISTLCCLLPYSFNHHLQVGSSAPGKFLSRCQQSWGVSRWLQALPGSWWAWAPILRSPTSPSPSARIPSAPTTMPSPGHDVLWFAHVPPLTG